MCKWLVLLFLLVCDVKIDGKEYPCRYTNLYISYDVSAKLSATSYKRQEDFLLNNVFTKEWNEYDSLTVISYATTANVSKKDETKSRAGVTAFIQNHGQTKESPSLCNVLIRLESIFVPARIFFVSYFQGPIDDDCISSIHKMQGYSTISFVVLNYDDVDLHLLRSLFPTGYIILWDINNEVVPDSWQQKMMIGYGCVDQYAKPPYPCDSNILLGYDASRHLTDDEFFAEYVFLVNEFFKKWTNFNHLMIWHYASTVDSTSIGQFTNFSSVTQYLGDIPKSSDDLEPCSIFDSLSQLSIDRLNAILFISSFDAEKVKSCRAAINTTNANLNSIAFVIMTDDVKIDDLKDNFPRAKIIEWKMGRFRIPPNWQWSFWSTFECGNDERSGYPCNTRVVVGFDRSNQITNYTKQVDFILSDVFSEQWSNFNNLAISDYSYIYPVTTNFGLLKNRDLLQKYIRSVDQDVNPLTFCIILDNILKQHVDQAYVIMFMSRLTTGFDDDCQDTIIKMNDQIAGLTVVNMSSNVNTDRLRELFPLAKVVSWDLDNDDKPKHWEEGFWRGFGCDGRSPLLGPYVSSTQSTSKKPTTTQKPPETSTMSTTTPKDVTPSNLALIVGISVPSAILLLWLFLTCFFLYRRKHLQTQENLKNALRAGYNVKENNEYTVKNDDPWEILPENVLINYEQKLGVGAFGEVYSGRLVGDAPVKLIYSDSALLTKFHDCKIAVKTVPAYCDELARNDFQQEMTFMKSLKFHPHVVCMLGHVFDPTAPLLVLEFCANGDLLNFLRKNKDKFSDDDTDQSGFKTKNLVCFAWQISNGLEYLSSLGHIHRDVAARNILLDQNNVCKISDFGLCRTSDNNLYTSKSKKLPIRWMALESLVIYEYSSKSDVWSYGILLFELFSLGSVPYYKMDNEQVLDFLEAGKRLDKPAFCPDEIYSIMLDSWRPDPEERPNFTGICSELMKMLETANESYNYVDAIRNVEVETTDSEGEATV